MHVCCLHAAHYDHVLRATGQLHLCCGSVMFTQDSMLASGDSGVPLGRKSSVSGSTSGSSPSPIATGSLQTLSFQAPRFYAVDIHWTWLLPNS